MTLTEKLLSLDAEEMEQVETKQFEIKSLSKKIGEPFVITIKPIPNKRFREIAARALDENGNPVPEKASDVQAMMCVHGVVEPDLKNKELMEHFGAETPKELAIKLFGGGVAVISDRLTELSGYDPNNIVEVKN